MKRHHSDIWHQTHIWRMIEVCFNKFEDLEAAIGESMSITSQNRKNQKRTISGIAPMIRKSMGHKCDSVFRTYQVQQSKGLEFGATEAKEKYINSSDHLKDALYKLPKTLKDILDNLIKAKPELIGSFQTADFNQNDLANTVLQVDKPTKSIDHITRRKIIEISYFIENFGATILLSMLSAWICTEIVNKVFQLLTSSTEEVGEEDLSWMTNYLEKEQVSPMPSTSRSTETSPKKRQKRRNNMLY